jgi:hypothetical protein
VLPKDWFAQSLSPCALNPCYGFLWWLNTDRQRFPAAPEQCFFALGTAGNVCCIDPESDIVVVVRWMNTAAINAFLELLYAAAWPPRPFEPTKPAGATSMTDLS